MYGGVYKTGPLSWWPAGIIWHVSTAKYELTSCEPLCWRHCPPCWLHLYPAAECKQSPSWRQAWLTSVADCQPDRPPTSCSAVKSAITNFFGAEELWCKPPRELAPGSDGLLQDNSVDFSVKFSSLSPFQQRHFQLQQAGGCRLTQINLQSDNWRLSHCLFRVSHNNRLSV